MFRKLIRFFLSTPVTILLGTTILALVVWFAGPLIGFGGVYPLEDLLVRVLVVVGLFVTAIIVILLILLRRRSRENRMAEEIAEAEPDPRDAATAEELDELKQRMREALGYLRKSRLGGRFGRRHLYQLPWYIVIGPPGAGKTTAIVNSGLKFPLADRMGLKAVGGVGGTRNCDWWFTNEAVLIDTAGRYTTQDSDADVDARAWSGFLDILKRYRKRQPVNGAIVAISLSDLSLNDDMTRKAHAAAIRRRLAELRDRLGVRFPVYVLFTKADLIAGFQEFFDPLPKEAREQVWGFTLPLPGRKDEPVPVLEGFEREFDALLERLNDQSLERMQEETNAERRSLVQAFPQQLASLREVAQDFLAEVFQQSKFEDQQFLRGVYFTSGTQEGTPIDRMMMSMARSFGIGRQAIGSGQGQGRSYFLTRLLTEVIFGEAGLVSADDRVERRYRWIVRGGIAAAVLVAVGMGVVWGISFFGNRHMVAEASEQIAAYQQALSGIELKKVGDTDFLSIVKPLNILRDMPGNPAQGDPEPPTELTWGLYQGDEIGSEAAQTYRSALNQLLLPRLLLKLEKDMEERLDSADFLFQALKVYLMLGQQGKLDRLLIMGWWAADWEERYPGDDNKQLRDDLAGHLKALITQQMKAIPLNGPLVKQVRAKLLETPMAERIYASIINSEAARKLPEWRITDAGGSETRDVLVRPSGKLLSEGVKGIYTYKGFHEVFLPALKNVPDAILDESWILGEEGKRQTTEQGIANTARDVLNRYLNDYVAAWNGVLGDLDIVVMNTPARAVQVTQKLSSPLSPIANILKSVASETNLTEKRETVDTEKLTTDARDFALDEATVGLGARTQAAIALLRRSTVNNPLEEKEAEPGQYVVDQFAWLHQFTGEVEGQGSPLKQMLSNIGDIYKELARVAANAANPLLTNTEDSGATERLLQSVALVPDPVRRWAQQIANSAQDVRSGGLRAKLNTIWQGQILPFCKRAVDGRYPFTRGSRKDAGLQDFAKLFAPAGLIDDFFTKNLLPHVDTSGEVWHWRRVPGRDLGISDQVLEAFQYAAQIRDAFFLVPGMPQISFEVKPHSLDPEAQSVILELNGQRLEWAHGPVVSTPMQWPGPAGQTFIALAPELPGRNMVTKEGPWAVFRLLDSARRTGKGPDEYTYIFFVGSRAAGFRIRAASALNPFTLPALDKFRCPASL